MEAGFGVEDSPAAWCRPPAAAGSSPALAWGLDLSSAQVFRAKGPDPWKCTAPVLFRDAPRRCRKCPGCMLHREWVWSRKGANEAVASRETRMVTLTCRGGVAPDYHAVQKFLAGVLKLDRTRRYLCTEETGPQGGRLHWHLLLHTNAKAVTKRSLEALWPHGFTVVRLARSEALARYIAKYNAKAGRMRASPRYGLCRVVMGCEHDTSPQGWESFRAIQLRALEAFAERRKMRLDPLSYRAVKKPKPEHENDPPDGLLRTAQPVVRRKVATKKKRGQTTKQKRKLPMKSEETIWLSDTGNDLDTQQD